MYQHPGVYIEEIPSGSAPIEAASTSTALIAGYTTKGPVGEPTLLFSFDQYVTQFGGIADFQDSPVDYMGHTVQAFFTNGGAKAYIVRLADDAHPPAPAAARLVVPLHKPINKAEDIQNYLDIQAASPGTWAHGLEIQADEMPGRPNRYTITIGRRDRRNNLVPSEVFTDVSLNPDDANDADKAANFIASKIKARSALITVAAAAAGKLTEDEKKKYMVGSLTSGDLSGLRASDFSGLNTKTVTIQVDPGADKKPVTFTSPKNLDDVQAQIQQHVTDGATPLTATAGFTCKVENGRLVLQSGVADKQSAITVTDDGPDTPSQILQLTLGRSQSLTGEQAFTATFSNKSSAVLAGGDDGTRPDSVTPELMERLLKIRDISIILLPGQCWSAQTNPTITAFISHAERATNRMVIVDPAPGLTSQAVLDQNFPSSTYAVTYYPWLNVPNPYYHPELRPNRAPIVLVPPSGFAAGLWAKTDARRGVWKAPAGLQASLLGAASTEATIGDGEQDQLNPAGVNCLRRIISDIVIWGSRTLATQVEPEWRYVPVRRTAILIEQSIYQGIQWAVFEPNDHRLWSSLRLNIQAFMDTLFRAGAFQGEKASDAYFVRCGLGDTMTQADVDAGQVIVTVGFAPLKPAEFVIVRIQQIVGRQ
jgi:phage tail sheath protein FI